MSQRLECFVVVATDFSTRLSPKILSLFMWKHSREPSTEDFRDVKHVNQLRALNSLNKERLNGRFTSGYFLSSLSSRVYLRVYINYVWRQCTNQFRSRPSIIWYIPTKQSQFSPVHFYASKLLDKNFKKAPIFIWSTH